MVSHRTRCGSPWVMLAGRGNWALVKIACTTTVAAAFFASCVLKGRSKQLLSDWTALSMPATTSGLRCRCGNTNGESNGDRDQKCQKEEIRDGVNGAGFVN